MQKCTIDCVIHNHSLSFPIVLERDEMVRVGETIRWLRKRNGYSVNGLADRLMVSPSYYGNIENGHRRLPPQHAKVLAEVFGMPLHDVMAMVGVKRMPPQRSSRPPKRRQKV